MGCNPVLERLLFVTARIRRMGEGTFFSLSVHTCGGGGYPISGLRWGGYLVPCPGGYPVPGLGGIPSPRSGGGGGYPVSGLGGYLISGPGYPPRQISIASSCYAAGGMPLVFTQEDFLVSIDFNESFIASVIF